VNHIDFLPESYHTERARQGVAHRRWVLIVLTALTLACWGVARHQRSADLARRTYALESQAQATQQKLSEMAKLRQERKGLLYQQKIQRQLSQPVAVTQTIATLGRLLPDSAGLTNLHVAAHRPPPKPLETPEDKKAKRTAKKAPEVDPETLRNYLFIEVQGIAPDDVAVANLVNTMSEHPLFDRVAMNFSRVDNRGDLLTRRFQIGAEVSMDKRYVPIATSAEVSGGISGGDR
jgi:Tfp pilus assembly protein PilN